MTLNNCEMIAETQSYTFRWRSRFRRRRVCLKLPFSSIIFSMTTRLRCSSSLFFLRNEFKDLLLFWLVSTQETCYIGSTAEIWRKPSTFYAKMSRPHSPLIYNDGVRRSKCIPYWTTTPNLKVVKFSLTVALNETKVAVRSFCWDCCYFVWNRNKC